jgi:uncharacterized RDD family membrane protein YckC
VSEVVTGEAVILDVPCARFPSRIAALLIDLLIQVVLLVAVFIAVFFSVGNITGAEGTGLILTSYVAIVVGYSAIFETLTRGKTPGKMALGLRVISDDGGPVRFRQALVRALTGAIEIWAVVGAPFGLLTSLVSAKGKRLGDMFAGTYVIQERAPRRPQLPPMFATVPPPLLGWAQVAETSRLTDQRAEAAGSYLRRWHELSPAARNDLGLRIASAMIAQVSPPPPPGTPPAAYLAAVLAIRREREHARLFRQRLGAADGTGGWAGQPETGQPPSQPQPWTAQAPPVQTQPSASPWASPAAPTQPAAGTWAAPAQTLLGQTLPGQTLPGQTQPAPSPWAPPAAQPAASPWAAPAALSEPAPSPGAAPAALTQPAPSQPAPSQPAGQPASGGFAPPA